MFFLSPFFSFKFHNAGRNILWPEGPLPLRPLLDRATDAKTVETGTVLKPSKSPPKPTKLQPAGSDALRKGKKQKREQWQEKVGQGRNLKILLARLT
jgi:hypothetical protein